MRSTTFLQTLFSLITFALPAHAAVAQDCGTMQNLGTFGGRDSGSLAVSADGQVVVGWANQEYGNVSRAFRWTAADGMVDLGTLGGNTAWATAVSGDGSIVVGNSLDGLGRYRAFRWQSPGPMQDLGDLGGGNSSALAISRDGRVVVGGSSIDEEHYVLVRWTAEAGIQPLQGMPPLATIHAISAEGDIIFGTYINSSNQRIPFRWTTSEGMQEIAHFDPSRATVFGMSLDGSVLVGQCADELNRGRAFRWAESTGLQILSMLPQELSAAAYAVSDDGNIVVGSSWNWIAQPRAFRWTLASGIQDLGDFGGIFSQAIGMSAHGGAIVGGAAIPSNQRRAFIWRDGTLSFAIQPASSATCNGDISYSVLVVGSETPEYHWQWRHDDLGQWTDIVAGENTAGDQSGFICRNNSQTARILEITAHLGMTKAMFRCVVSSACATAVSIAANFYSSPADVGRQGGIAGEDGLYNNNDFIVFIGYFFEGNPRADMGRQGGVLGSDGYFDNNDFVAFINQFFAGC
ncbi:MAG: GC-type dockerin domain-anchored protein [Phycisphaerales bacterium]